MAKFLMRIREIREKEVVVEADNSFEASKKANRLWCLGEINLDEQDIEGYEFFEPREITPECEQEIDEEMANNIIDRRIY